ncbi:MAG: hypothetical protein QME05_03725 [Candidatus Margulisbacteria bacterium]|nr:hypothetical protein [Candidatus Margulisiibacteriota bacterium]
MRFSKLAKEAPFISKDNFRLLFPGIKDESYNQNIKNWIKTKKIIALKRGIYIFADYWQKCQAVDEYLNYLASVLYAPSYVSMETVLAKYGMLTEAVFGLSSVTVKTSRRFAADIALFTYSSIREPLFLGFIEDKYFDYPYYIATKSKALFDFLYFFKRRTKTINQKTVDELRINIDNMEKSDWKEFEKYMTIANDKKLNKIYQLLRSKNAA